MNAEPRCEADAVLDDLRKSGHLPKELLAVTACGRDENYLRRRVEDIQLISPTSGKAPADHLAR